MGEKELLIPVADLRFLEVSCPKCKTAFTFDVDANQFFPEEKCPTCTQMWDSFTGTIPQAFRAYKQFYGQFSKMEKMNPRFRIKEQ